MDTTKISETAQGTLKRLLEQKIQLENQIQSYIQGIKDSMNLKGENWVVNLQDMVFTQQSVNGDKPDVVGAAAGGSSRESDK